MKKRPAYVILSIVIVAFAAGLIAYYLYDVIVLKTPFTENLFRTLAVSCLLLGTLLRAFHGAGRKSLEFYEKSYEEELGSAFQDKPMARKRLLCACRLYDEENFPKALKYLSILINEAESERDKYPVLLFTALCFSDAGLSEQAIETYNKMLEISPDDSQVHSNLGLLYHDDGNNEKAMLHYNKAVECDPRNYYAYNNRAKCYFDMKQYDEAVSDAKNALDIKNDGGEASSLLTIIYALQNDRENKEKYYHMAVAAGEDPDELQYAIKYFMRENE